jgi:hypothetical protein
MGSDSSRIFSARDGMKTSSLSLHKDKSYVWENKHFSTKVDVEISKGFDENTDRWDLRDIIFDENSLMVFRTSHTIRKVEYVGKSQNEQFQVFEVFYNHGAGREIIIRRDEEITKYVIRSQTGVNQFTRTVYIIHDL